jgi:anthranilate synthase component 2
MQKILLIDNYDSFTWNLWHSLAGNEGIAIDVIMHDDQRLKDDLSGYDKLVFSPGPGLPEEAGMMMELMDKYCGHLPILGVCLGHQGLAIHYGAKLKNLPQPLHGMQRTCSIIQSEPLFRGLNESIPVGHYHSWVIDEETLNEDLLVNARGPGNIIMGIQHLKHPSFGIQFHPESVMTPDGDRIIRNFLEL